MSWIFGTINFDVFGVIVSRSSGVLDLPKLKHEGTDWLDIDGKDYWQDDTQYNDREIVLNCWMMAVKDDLYSGYENFRTKVQEFTDAIKSQGKVIFQTPYVNIADCSISSGISVVRETNYVNDVQAGTFTLRITVHGDPETKPITIYDVLGGVRGVYYYRSDARLNRRIMSDDSVPLSLEFNQRDTALGRDDYILVDGVKYSALEYFNITKFAGNKFKYDITFYHEFFKLKDIAFRVNDEADSYIWTTMEGLVDLIVSNTGRRYPGLFAKGNIDATENRNHQFSCQTCYDMLTQSANDYELEWGYRVVSGVVYIDVKKKIGSVTSISLGLGKGQGLQKIYRPKSDRQECFQYLYAYGSSKNLPVGYGSTRLRLASMPLYKWFYEMAIEKTKTWDDVFPHRTGTVTSYTYTPSDDPDNYPERAKYELTDSSMPFDLNETDEYGTVYLISGTSAKIHFNSGNLAGFEFEIEKYDHSTKTFTLIQLKEDNGDYYPNENLYPAAGDEYVLIDINLPQSYIDAAEAELLALAQAEIDYYYAPRSNFEVTTEPGYELAAELGDYITLDDDDFTAESLRVISIAKNLYTGVAELTLHDEA